MEKGLAYMIITCIIILLVTAGSLKKGFHSARFTLSSIAIFFMPGLAMAGWKGIHMMISDQALWLPLTAGFAAGLIFYRLVLKRWWGFSTFEHELTHALMALLFFRKIKKFVVTRYEGGYIVNTTGFGGATGNHFIALAPYFLPTFTLLSVMIRPLMPVTWFPWYDVWTGITFSYQTMSNYGELKQNWTGHTFPLAQTGKRRKTDIGQEGFIFSFIIILALKLLFLSLMMYIIAGSFVVLPEWMGVILNHSTGFYIPVFEEMLAYIKGLIS